MRKRTITNEQLILLDKLMKEGKSNDEIYQVLGVKYYAIPLWKSKIIRFGLGELLQSEVELNRERIFKEVDELDPGEDIYIGDEENISVPAIITALYRKSKKFSKIRQAKGWLLTRVED